jgi:beta-lactamase regulating signal transducer with metallopeptidase domain
MSFIHDILSERLLHALGCTLIHSLWQGALVAIITGFIFLVLRKRSAKIRYAIAVASLATLVLISSATFIRTYTDMTGMENQTSSFSNVASERNLLVVPDDDLSSDRQLADQTGFSAVGLKFSAYFNRHFPLLITGWFMGILFFMLKLLGGLLYSERLKHTGIKAISESWQKKVSELGVKMNIRRQVRIVESYFAKVPMVIGYFKPVILVPVGILSGIPAEQVEAIIAHELAHIRRYDFLINIVQSIVESIFFYHPAVWWISGQVRKERENCCDDLAVSVCKGSLIYAKALANLQERVIGTPYFAVAFAGRNYSLLSRIKRLNQKQTMKNNMSEKWITIIGMIIVILVLTTILRVPGINTAEAATKSNEEVMMGMLNFEFPPAIANHDAIALQDTIKKPNTRTIKTSFFDAADQKDKEVKILFEGDKVKELYVDGEKIPEDQMHKYQELIDNTLAELKEAEKELEMAEEELRLAEKTLAEIDFEDIHLEMEHAKEEMERAMQEMKEIDMEEISREIELAKQSYKEAMENFRHIDMEEIKQQYREMEEEFREYMQEFREEDWDKFREEMELARQKMEEAMKDINMDDLNEEFKKMQQELQYLWNDFDTTRIRKEMQRNIEHIQQEMQHFNQEHMEELKREMEEARQMIQKSLQELKESEKLEREELYLERQYESQRRMQEAEEHRRSREEESVQRAQQREQEARMRYTEQERRVQEAERMAREEREIERERRDEIRQENKAISIIKDQLVADEFYTEGESIDFELSTRRLKIDGKKQPKEIFEKYKKIYEETSGSLPSSGTIMIKN